MWKIETFVPKMGKILQTFYKHFTNKSNVYKKIYKRYKNFTKIQIIQTEW